MKVAVILPAAGLGTRMGKGSAEKTGTSRKQFMLLEGSPILIHTVRKFAASPRVAEIVVAVRAEDLEWVGEMLAEEFPPHRVRVVEGGNSRQQSVENALPSSLPIRTWWRCTTRCGRSSIWRPSDASSTRRPRPAPRSWASAGGYGEAGDAAAPATSKVRATLPREKLVLAQTPQVFRYELIQAGVSRRRAQDGFTGTDESSLVERLDVEVSVVLGSDRNIKITKPGRYGPGAPVPAGRDRGEAQL